MQLSLVFPFQLFAENPALELGRVVFLLEESLIFGPDPVWPLKVHVQKRVFHRASMRAYAAELRSAGYEVNYLECKTGKTLSAILDGALPAEVSEVHLCELHDNVLTRRVSDWAQGRQIKLCFHSSPQFLSPIDWLEGQLDRKKPFMATFYKAQRKRMGILVDAAGEPTGGRWSFDEENRKKLPKGHGVPSNPVADPDPEVERALEWVKKRFPDSPGSVQSFPWPVNRGAAKIWLDDFLKRRLELFGDYEDALHTDERVLYHSQLTPLLNSGLLTPAEVVEATLKFADTHQVPLNSLEGFLRQIIGWREFMLGMYRLRGVEARSGNFWGFEREMPPAFYSAETGIAPVDEAIRRVLDHAYCHHIERLMVLGSFMLLCRIRPDAVYRWFMELFIDAYDWVMVPNVYGMSQFADGGIFTTKPYLCGSNYIRKMSNFPKGEWCEVWDGLYWTFIADYQEVFARNHRMSMMARNVDRMDPKKLAAHRERAEAFLEGLN